MNCTTTTSDLPTETQGVVFDLGGLYAEFERLTDQRKARGKRYRLALVLLLIVLAKLCGEDRPYGMAQWISARTHSLIAILGLACHRLPSLNTYRRVLQQAVDVGQLQKAVKRFLCRDPSPGHHVLVSIDGKTLRGSFDPGQGQAVHLLAAYLPKEGIVLMQVAVASQENGLSAAPRLLQCLDLRGQEIDVSMTEAMLRTLDFLAIEYDQLGAVRTASGNRSQYAAPGNIYRTKDGKWASIAASTQSIFTRLCSALDLKGVLSDSRFVDNPARVKNRDPLDELVGGAIAKLTLAELRARLDAHEVGFSPIYDASDVFADPQFAAREAIVRVPDSQLGEVRMQCVVPRFSETPGAVRRAGPALGEHNEEVYAELGCSKDDLARLRNEKVI